MTRISSYFQIVKVSRNYRMSGQNEQNLPRRAAGLVSRRAGVGDTLGLADGAHAFCKPLTETAALLRAPRRICASRTQRGARSEEHTSELQSPMRNSYTVFRLKKKTKDRQTKDTTWEYNEPLYPTTKRANGIKHNQQYNNH